MSATITLPSPLRTRLASLRRRIGLLRAVSGLSMLVFGLGWSAVAAMAVDCWLDLPPLTRQIVFSTWLAASVIWLLRGVIVPLCRRIDAAALAALIEEKYPDLGERLSSAVELADASAEGHGSPLLIALLLEETSARSEQLDFRAAVPAHRAVWLAALALATVLLSAVAALVWPQQWTELAQRFFQPWLGLPAEASADIVVSPSAAPIVPVELAADSPTITITPPTYARSVREEETLHGLVDLAPLQYSEIRFDFRFTRPAVAAYLEERQSASDESQEKTIRHPLALSSNGQAASLTIRALKERKYRLILEAEQETRTELPGGTIRVQNDQPPSVRRCTGMTESRSVLPYERIPLEIEAVDDIGVAGIELEYRVNDGETVRRQLELEGGNTPSAAARHVLELAGKVQEDDWFSYRFRVSDNLPNEYKGPHVVFYPPDRWLTLRIARRGNTLQQQDILAQRDEINRRLKAIRESLLREKRGLDRVKQEMRGQASRLPDPLDSIQELLDQNRANQKALRDAAQLADAPTGETPVPSPALQPVADLARDVADQEMHKSQQALEQARRQTAEERNRRLKMADEQLGSAVKRLEELKKTNDRLAQERLHQSKLEMLAQREKHLAERAAKLASKHPVLDPKAPELAEKLKREQAETKGELERLAQQSESLKQSLHRAQQEEAQNLAERARQLAKAQRDLARTEAESKPQRASDRNARPTTQQQAQQRRLQEETGELRRQFQGLTQQARNSGPMQSALQRATSKSQQAQQAMQQARDRAYRGEATAEKQSQERAAQQLDQAARAASEAARSPAPHGNAGPKPKSINPKAGAAVAKAGQQMAEAQGQLNRGQSAQAQSAMQQAADALALAAQRMAAIPTDSARRSGMPGQAIGLGRQAGGLPDLSAYGPDKARYAGKSWGELPGELRTKIVQDMKARYGDDYARMIKSYFEQIADTKK